MIHNPFCALSKWLAEARSARVYGCRGFQNLCRRAGFNNLTGLHNQQVIGHVTHHRQIMPNQHPRNAAIRLQRLQQIQNLR